MQYVTKAFLKGWNSGLFVNFGQFPCFLDPDPYSNGSTRAKSMRIWSASTTLELFLSVFVLLFDSKTGIQGEGRGGRLLPPGPDDEWHFWTGGRALLQPLCHVSQHWRQAGVPLMVCNLAEALEVNLPFRSFPNPSFHVIPEPIKIAQVKKTYLRRT